MKWSELLKEKGYQELFGRPVCAQAYHQQGIKQWDSFWSHVQSDACGTCCAILDIGRGACDQPEDSGGGSYKENVNSRSGMYAAKCVVTDDATRTIVVRLHGMFDLTLSIDITLLKGAQCGLTFQGIVADGSRLDLSISSNQHESHSRFLYSGRLVCADHGVIKLRTGAVVAHGAKESFSTHASSILQVGSGGNIEGIPTMDVGNDCSTVRHGFSVGRIPRETSVYMESRGLSRDTAEELYVKGFLKGNVG